MAPKSQSIQRAMGLSEFDIIQRYFSGRQRANPAVDLGIGDDAAVMSVPAGRRLATAVDTLVAGVHFPPDVAARYVGHRSLAVNLSDLAAMGAEPVAATLALTLPAPDSDWIGEFAAGFFDLAERFNVALIGGDTTRGPLAVTVNILGYLPAGLALTRSGARAADTVWVTGSLGDAAAGLEALEQNADTTLRERFLKPEPRIEAGRKLLGLANSAIDVSDGLIQDLGHLAAASGVGITVDLDSLPLSDSLLGRVGPDRARTLALSGGDDYELCFTAPRAAFDPTPASVGGVPCAAIGRVHEGHGVVCESGGTPVDIEVEGYDHFSRGPES